MKKRRVPINRNNLFFDDESFQLEVEMGREYLGSDVNQTIILYRVDRVLTNIDDVYEEAKIDGIRYKTPVELRCYYEIEESSNKAYIDKNNAGRYKQTGQLIVYIYESELVDQDVEITYGDFIGVQINETHMEYFEVVDDGKRNFSNSETMYGYNKFWRTIKAASVDKNVFKG